MALTANGYTLFMSIRAGNWQPGYLSHIGLALALTGAASANGFETKEKLTLVQGQPLTAMGCTMTFTTITDNAKGFDCHLDVTDKSGHSFQATLPHEFPKNAEGVMKKPYIEGYLAYDLYFSPASIERPEGTDPGSIFLKKGESAKVGKYDVTFTRFEVADHGDETDSVMSAAALVSVAYNGQREELAPLLKVRDRQVIPDLVPFDSGRASVMIAGLRPEDGGVMLKFAGESIGAAVAQPATMVLELSKKPFINVFWMGTLIAFLGGILSMYERRRRRQAEPIDSTIEGTASAPLQPVAHDAA
jgi:cytochrome c-type biogenesis protein CcmF